MDVRSNRADLARRNRAPFLRRYWTRSTARRPEAWQRLVDLYGRWSIVGVGNWALPADAADVVQDVFAAVAAGAGRFPRKTGTQFRAWLRTVTRNKVCDHFRRRRGLLDAEGGTAAQQRLLNLPESVEESLSMTSRLDPDARFVHRAVLDVVLGRNSSRKPGTPSGGSPSTRQSPAEVLLARP